MPVRNSFYLGAKRAKPVTAFNARGVVAAPAFTLSMPAGLVGPVCFTVHAHPVLGSWIAEPSWSLGEGALQGSHVLPNQRSQLLATRSEAVELALSRGIRQMQAMLGQAAHDAKWQTRFKQLRQWQAEAMREVRANDESLPLRGLTGIDLFAGGLGGLSLGMVSMGVRVALACEIDPEARRTYQRNIQPEHMLADIRTLLADCKRQGIPLRTDIVSMGLLCQAFSKAGKGLGFADPALADAYAAALDVLDAVDARVILIECARQFLTHDGGKDARTLIDRLTRAGYRVQHRSLNAAGFGVAQSRERSFIVATRIGLNVDDILGYIFPEEQQPTAVVGDVMDAGLPATIEAKRITPNAPAPAGRVGELAQVGRIDGKNCQGYRVYCPKGLAPSLTASGGGAARFTGAFEVPGGARTLTPREANRLQGMPEWAEVHPVHTHAMRHAGNAVAVPLARELVRQLGPILRRAA
jgi:DNA (cytosine-5)-methyltransferase 1